MSDRPGGSAASWDDRDADDVDDVTSATWGLMDPDTGWHAFLDGRREDAERRLLQATARKEDSNLVLVTRLCRRRTEKWYGETEIVPWHTPCSWVNTIEGAEAGDPDWCVRHKHHQGEPVPAEHIRGVSV